MMIFALNSQLQPYQILTNDHQMRILCRSYFITTVLFPKMLEKGFFLDKVNLLLEFGVLLTYETNEGNQLDWIGISWGFVLLPKMCVVFLQLNAYIKLIYSEKATKT